MLETAWPDPALEADRDALPGRKSSRRSRTVAAYSVTITLCLLVLGRHVERLRFLDVILRSGKRDTLFRGDLVSGAIIASIVERTKELAIKRAISSAEEEGISESDLLLSLNTEYSENDIFPPTDIVEDWLKLIDYDSENVVKVSPIRPISGPRSKGVSAVV